MASFTPAVKSVCLKTRPLILLLVFMNFISDGKCQIISLSCPNLQEDSKITFNCTVRTSNCSHSFVTFNFESKDGTPITQCQASSSTCGQQLQDGMTCGCVLSASGFNHYHLIFEGKKDPYDEGKLTCSANCAPLPVDGAICKPLIFAVPSTSPSTTTVKSAFTSYSPSATTSSNSSSTETGNEAGSGASMHVFRTAIVASMSGIIALISADFS